jgi:putative membrane-bound dehydrogenase-like protein
MPARALIPLLSLLTLALPLAGKAPRPPVPPQRAAALMKLPKGFRATLFAGEPDLVKPIAMTLDERGRLWVVESHSYPRWITNGKPGRDRVLIFEDRKGTGSFDSCKVFLDNGANLSGIAVGFGGVWLCATPNLLFVPIKPGTDRPAGPPRVVLDGWDLKAGHNVFNALTWGPDGWLYGCNGILSNSRVGKPGTPKDRRVAINCGVWRYHPTKKTFEAFAHGTTNPWGLDFDDVGEMFITNCVIKHIFHVVPGAHFVRMYGQDLNPFCYGLLESCADHIHWGGGSWTSSRGGKGGHDKAGGGHAHTGAMVYLGDNWPAKYRHRVFMCNIHGNRVNMDVLKRRGSGYVAKHGEDFLLLTDDPWFRGMNLLYGPDGGVFVSDWHDTGECHNYDKVQPCGRIFKVTYGKPAHVAVDLGKLDDDKLVKLQLHKNDWWVRQARRLLQERASAGKLAKTVHPTLRKMLAEQIEVPRKLRALWALHVTGGADEKALRTLLDSPHEEVRVWAVRLLVDDRKVSATVAKRLAELAQADKSAAVRLALASALQRLPLADRWAIAKHLAARAEDAKDANLPLMIWYGIEALVPADPERAARLLVKARIPQVRQNIARRITAGTGKLDPLVRVLGPGEDAVRRDVLGGMHRALLGQRSAPAPRGWSAVHRKLSASKDAEVRQKVMVLSVIFGDPLALAVLRKTAGDARADRAARRTALQTLVDKRVADLVPLLHNLLDDRALRRPALRALAAYRDSGTPARILKRYAKFSEAEKADALATLASRPAYGLALLEAMERKKVARRDLSVFTARQLLALKDRRVTDRLNKVWGTIRPTAKDKAKLLVRYLKLAQPKALQKADRRNGRLVYSRTCASCHVLFDAGGKIGPELTGAQRGNPEYILSKVLDPNAVVARDYQVTVIRTSAGRTISGIIKEETDKVVSVQTPTELIRLPKSDIEERTKSTSSLMPEGQLATLTDVQIRDLLAYLGGAGQVALPKGTDKKSRR